MKAGAGQVEVAEGARLVVQPGRQEVLELEGYTHVLVSAELSSDLETPVSTFMKLRCAPDEPCFMLESAESGRMWGRYSFLGFAPSAIASVEGGSLTVTTDGGKATVIDGDPVQALFGMVEQVRLCVPTDPSDVEGAPPFEGGAVGFFGYGTLGLIEKVRLEKEAGIAGIPDVMFMFPRRLVVFDHLRSRMRLCALVDLRCSEEERGRAYDAASTSRAATASRSARTRRMISPASRATCRASASSRWSPSRSSTYWPATRSRSSSPSAFPCPSMATRSRYTGNCAPRTPHRTCSTSACRASRWWARRPSRW
jgi:anthranilate/para-aminobenzoate synthase component I